MERRTFIRTFLVLLLTAAWLLLYPFIHRQSPWLQAHFRTYHFFQPFFQMPTDTLTAPALDRFPVPSPADTVSRDTAPAVSSPVADWVVPEIGGDYLGLSYLTPFFQKLRQATDQQVRIAYYGDSSIEGDIISQTFRESLQKTFGGSGVGFVPITSEIYGFRRSVRHRFSNNWREVALVHNNHYRQNRGISGQYFIALSMEEVELPNADSTNHDSLLATIDRRHWVRYQGTANYRGTEILPRTRLFFGRPNGLVDSLPQTAGIVYVRADEERLENKLRIEHLVNDVMLVDQPSSSVRLHFGLYRRVPFYGISFDSSTGVIVDNFSARGDSGQGLRRISKPVLAAFQKHLDYDLIILQYGLNVLNHQLRDYTWYERQIKKSIRHLQEALPGVPILLIGVPDRAVRLQGRMQTDPSVPRITEAQRASAEAMETAFFSFYEAMGGPGSMIQWVEEASPRLANSDYTHFNFRGGRRASTLLFDFLMEGYTAFTENTTDDL